LNRIQHHVEIFAYILGEETQPEIAILLEQLVLATIFAIGIDAFQMLRTIQLDGDARIGAQQVDFQSTQLSDGIGNSAFKRKRPRRQSGYADQVDIQITACPDVIETAPPPSYPLLLRASTPFLPSFSKQGVDGRDKPGRDFTPATTEPIQTVARRQ